MMTINLPPELEKRLKGEASRHGMAADEYARKLIAESLPQPQEGLSPAELFAQWNAEDATDDPIQQERQERELQDFKEAMNRNRLEMEGPNSRKPFP